MANFCQKCGAPLIENDSFCRECGTQVVNDMLVTANPLQNTTEKKNKNSSVVIVVAIIMIVCSAITAIVAVSSYKQSNYYSSLESTCEATANEMKSYYDQFNQYSMFGSIFADEYKKLYDEAVEKAEKAHSKYIQHFVTSIVCAALTVGLLVGGIVLLVIYSPSNKQKQVILVSQPPFTDNDIDQIQTQNTPNLIEPTQENIEDDNVDYFNKTF